MIPVVFNCDNNYILPTCVVIVSIMENDKNANDYHFIILLSERATSESVSIIERLRNRYRGISVRVYESDKIVENAVTSGNHITTSTYLRLFIASTLPQYKKCIFLDSDIIVNCDLHELYNIDIKNNYVAGVQEFELARNENAKIAKCRELSVDNVDEYIYAGVMLMNLQLIRNDELEKEFVKYIVKGYMYQDQDIINKCCWGKIGKIPLKYNFLNRHVGLEDLLQNTVYNSTEIDETKKGKVIIHFPGKNKPWVYPRCKGGDVWWNYAKLFLTEEEKTRYVAQIEPFRKKMEWDRLLEACEGKSNIVIWGFSEIGKYVYTTLKKCGIKDIISFCDNNEAKNGQVYEEICVKDIKKVLKRNKNIFVINTSQRSYYAINQQLEKLGVDSESIYTYSHKGLIYYKSLMKSEYEYELRSIYFRETGSNEFFDKMGMDRILELLRHPEDDREKEIIYIYKLDQWLLHEQETSYEKSTIN